MGARHRGLIFIWYAKTYFIESTNFRGSARERMETQNVSTVQRLDTPTLISPKVLQVCRNSRTPEPRTDWANGA